ncbi:hypothetical protein Pla163_27150 [Planctomycetes bacterium Pla163]|uniref:Phosphate-selective porin O and P n=1 Tax=Rohdeia mirabilis TaxID=2528008 RepID=A0A518D271_9BACT|nr:hypothetical protein Pla163_27150 [Planctomycetes bacterium Pla163]
MDYSLFIALWALVAPEPAATGSVGPFGPVLEDQPAAVVGAELEPDPDDVAAPPVNDLALGGTLAARYDRSFGRDATLPDEAGTTLSDAIVALRGTWYGYRFEVALEFDETNGSTLDRMFVESDLDQRHRLRVGLIRNPFLYSSFADEDGFVFPYRTRLGREFMSTDEGLEFLADYGRADLRLSFTNGNDGVADSRRGTLRAGFHVLGERIHPGERPRPEREGLSFFLAYTDDGSFVSGDAFAIETHAQAGRFRFHGEWVDAADGIGDQRGLAGTLSAAFDGGATELAVRAETLKAPQRRQVFGVAATHSLMRDVLRVQGAIEHVSGPGTLDEGFTVSAGLVISL